MFLFTATSAKTTHESKILGSCGIPAACYFLACSKGFSGC